MAWMAERLRNFATSLCPESTGSSLRLDLFRFGGKLLSAIEAKEQNQILQTIFGSGDSD